MSIDKLKELLKTKITLGQIYSIDENEGKVKVKYLTESGFKTLNMPAVYMGNDSWIRAYPQIASFVLIAETDDGQYPEIIKIFDPSEKTRFILDEGKQVDEDPKKADSETPRMVGDRVSKARTGKDTVDEEGTIGFPYRRLKTGELEASSNGKSSWWLGRNGELVLKGGLSKIEMDPFTSSIQSFSAGHSKLGPDSTVNSLNDEEYFGVVRRPTSNITLTKNNIEQRLNKIDNSESYVEKIKLEIDNRTEKAIKQQDSFNREYQRVDDDLKIPLSEKLKKSLGLGEEDENKKIERNLSDLVEIYSQQYISSLDELYKYSVSYIDSTDSSLTRLNEITTELKGWQEELRLFVIEYQNFIKNNENSQEVNLKLKDQLKSGKWSSDQYELQKISDDIKSLISSKTEEDLENKKSNLQSELKEVESRHIYPSLITETFKDKQVFAKEYRISVSFAGDVASDPITLYDRKTGHVYDQEGSSEGLRSKEIFYTQGENSDYKNNTMITVDNNGNMKTYLSEDATEGVFFDIPKGQFNINAKKEFHINITGGSTSDSHGSTIQVDNGSLILRAGQYGIQISDMGIKFLGVKDNKDKIIKEWTI